MKMETYWREVLGYFRTNLIIFFILSVTNWICLMRTDLELRRFLIGLNGGVWIGTMILLLIIDLGRDKILKLFKTGERR
jgi:hypothetical protein